MNKNRNERDIYNEVQAIQFMQGYSPAQILMNSHNYNYTLEDYKNSCSKNKNIVRCIDLLLELCRLYEYSFQMVGASKYTDLSLCNLQGEYNRLVKEYTSSLKKAKDSVINLCIKEGKIYYTDVYQIVLKKRDALLKKINSGKGNNMSDYQLGEYNYIIRKYNEVSWDKHPLFD